MLAHLASPTRVVAALAVLASASARTTPPPTSTAPPPPAPPHVRSALESQDAEAPADTMAPPQVEFPLEFAFAPPLAPYRGIDRLEELRGRPVLIAYWWLDSVEADYELRNLLRRLEPYAGQVEVLLCESSKLPDEEHDRFLWDLGAFAHEVHTFRGEPAPRTWHAFHAYLLDATGRVAWWGRLDDPFEETLEKRIEEVRDDSDYPDAGVRKGWKRFHEGDWKGAHKSGSIARKNGLRAIERGETQPEGELDLLTQGELLVLAVEDRHLAWCERANRMLDAGRPAAAADLLEAIEDRGEVPADRCVDAFERLEKRLKKSDVKKAVRADRELAEILTRAAGDLEQGGRLAEEAEALRAFAADHEGTALGDRARAVLALLDVD